MPAAIGPVPSLDDASSTIGVGAAGTDELPTNTAIAPRVTRSTCPYCGVGCGVLIDSVGHGADARIIGVRGDPAHPANFGRLCTKGSTLHLTATPAVRQQQRLLQPAWRPSRGEPLEPMLWPDTTAALAQRLLDIRATHGPEAIGFYISGQLLTEDYHAFNKLARGLIGTNHIDSNSRLCMSAAVVGYKQSLGADAPPTCYGDLALADCLFIAGANTAWAHPVLFRRIEDSKAARPQQRIIVVDPRRTETAEFADLHLAIRPGTDVALFHGMLNACIWEGWIQPDWIDRHTHGFEALKTLVRGMTPTEAARITGVKETALLQAAQWFAQSPATLSLYCMGLNQSSSGTAKNTALINLHLATAQIGRPGAGPFSLTGQPNAMGGRETGGMATLLPGHRDPAIARHREEIAALWGVETLPDQPGRTAIELFQAAARGEIKALWMACTNPAQSLPDQALVREALQRCELVILQEAFAGTETAAYADVLLPAATWGEKEGTVTNSERRISRVRAALTPAGESRPDWQIVRDVGRAMEATLRPAAHSLFDWTSPEHLWLEHREATRGRDLDITGLSYAQMEAMPCQWPYPAQDPDGAPGQTSAEAAPTAPGRVQASVLQQPARVDGGEPPAGPQPMSQAGTARLYLDGRFAHADGRARFIAKPYQPPVDVPEARFPLTLSTGRLRDQWHGMSRSGAVPRLFAAEPGPALSMHPADMDRRRLTDGALVQVQSRRGSLLVPLRADPSVGPQQAWLPMHWGSAFLGGRGQTGINALTQPAYCPDARQPELKFAAVSVTAVALPWQVVGAAWVPAGEGALLRDRLRGLMPEADYGCCVPVPCGDGATGTAGEASAEGWRLTLAFASQPPAALVRALASVLQLEGVGVLRYADGQRGRSRLLRIEGERDDARLQALLRVGEGDHGAWIDELWRERRPVSPYGRRLLAPDAEGLVAPRSPQICNCFDVREDAITACVQRLPAGPADQRLQALQQALRCGTSCGSCLPSLRRLVMQGDAAPAITSGTAVRTVPASRA